MGLKCLLESKRIFELRLPYITRRVCLCYPALRCKVWKTVGRRGLGALASSDLNVQASATRGDLGMYSIHFLMKTTSTTTSSASMISTRA